MAQRTIKNYTESDLVLNDLGEEIIPANGALDMGGNESRLLELASSDDLLTALGQGIDKYQVNDGSRDLSLPDGIDLIRKIQTPTQRDERGAWIVRSDSRRLNYSVIFSCAGDDLTNHIIGGGKKFSWDFSNDDDLITAPEGFKRKRIDVRFMDGIYMKEGTMYFFNALKGSYVDFMLAVPTGAYYEKKFIDSDNAVYKTLAQATEETVIAQWVFNYMIEGSAPMGDELNTEACSDDLVPENIIWRIEVTSPDITGIADFHGHFGLEFYRGRTVYYAE